MKHGPNIAQVAALIGDPARCNMLTALMGGIALTAGELAQEAGVSPQTASAHLRQLVDAGLLRRYSAGRHRYFMLGGEDVASLLENLMTFADTRGRKRTRSGPNEPALRTARSCYNHLAGEKAVAMLDGLVRRKVIDQTDDALRVTAHGERFFEDFGIDVPALRARKGTVCRPCLDWSERRFHIAGSLGTAILSRFVELHWVRRHKASRAVLFTPAGLREFRSFCATPDWDPMERDVA